MKTISNRIGNITNVMCKLTGKETGFFDKPSDEINFDTISFDFLKNKPSPVKEEPKVKYVIKPEELKLKFMQKTEESSSTKAVPKPEEPKVKVTVKQEDSKKETLTKQELPKVTLAELLNNIESAGTPRFIGDSEKADSSSKELLSKRDFFQKIEELNPKEYELVNVFCRMILLSKHVEVKAEDYPPMPERVRIAALNELVRRGLLAKVNHPKTKQIAFIKINNMPLEQLEIQLLKYRVKAINFLRVFDCTLATNQPRFT
ncbi:unnamed protein product [Caenorhabditis bovis]|nr:unnamed protein product [Caenorhabditis bovis]